MIQVLKLIARAFDETDEQPHVTLARALAFCGSTWLTAASASSSSTTAVQADADRHSPRRSTSSSGVSSSTIKSPEQNGLRLPAWSRPFLASGFKATTRWFHGCVGHVRGQRCLPRWRWALRLRLAALRYEYTERYMEPPRRMPRATKLRTSQGADGLNGKFLLTHALMDENVHYAHGTPD